MLRSTSSIGKILFAVCLAGFAIVQFVTGSFPTALIPLPKDLPGQQVGAYITGLIYLATSISIFTGKKAKTMLAITGLVFLIIVLYPQLPRLISDVHNPGAWIGLLEILCLSAGSFIIADSFGVSDGLAYRWTSAIRIAAIVGRYLVAIAFIIFGIQHIMYEPFIYTLMPQWMPGIKILSKIVIIGFLAGPLAIIINVQARLACLLLAAMFLCFFLFLHISLIIKNYQKESEWTSLFVVLAMTAICLVMAAKVRKVKLFGKN